MKNIILLVLLFLFCNIVYAQSAEEYYKEGKEIHENADFNDTYQLAKAIESINIEIKNDREEKVFSWQETVRKTLAIFNSSV